MKGNGELPASDAARVLALVERSAPDPERPRLGEEWEVMLADIDAKSAACYASMEDLSDRLDRLAVAIREEDGVVIDDVREEDSLVVHLDEVKGRLPETAIAAAPAGNGSVKR
jgi:hypothetical protein